MSWKDFKGSKILIKILPILLILIDLTHCNLEDLEPKLDESKWNYSNINKHDGKIKQGHVILFNLQTTNAKLTDSQILHIFW